jgi:membrane peptidoglycan carboxypeptidase
VVRPGRAEGGSTITMQLARNLFPEQLPYTDRGPVRKLREIRVARQIERSFSKDKILELYLNHIYLGAGAYGIEAASRTYFGKPAAELTVEEAALMLGGLPRRPRCSTRRATVRARRERRNLVLREMAQAGFISEAEAESMRGAADPAGAGRPRGGRPTQLLLHRAGPPGAGGGRRPPLLHRGAAHPHHARRGLQQAAEQELARQLDAIESGRFGAYPHAETYAARATPSRAPRRRTCRAR